jgi:erythromycin 3''-O-methyltransferase
MTKSMNSPVEKEIRSFYTDQLTDLYLTETTMYLNFGYWSEGCAGPDEACRAMADLLADAAGITEGDRVLDVGFGYADQDIHWLTTRRPALIAGLNVTPAQVEVARRRGSEAGLQDRLDLRVGSATQMPFEAETFDRVVALESAFHFDTRADFFREAARVLRPGGTLATADIILQSGERESRLRELGSAGGLIPPANWYDAHEYAGHLEDAGFVDAHVRLITDRVYEPATAYVRQQKQKSGAGNSATESLGSDSRGMTNTEYVIASARKAARTA